MQLGCPDVQCVHVLFSRNGLPNIAWGFRQRCEGPSIYLTFLDLSNFLNQMYGETFFMFGIWLTMRIWYFVQEHATSYS